MRNAIVLADIGQMSQRKNLRGALFFGKDTTAMKKTVSFSDSCLNFRIVRYAAISCVRNLISFCTSSLLPFFTSRRISFKRTISFVNESIRSVKTSNDLLSYRLFNSHKSSTIFLKSSFVFRTNVDLFFSSPLREEEVFVFISALSSRSQSITMISWSTTSPLSTPFLFS